MVEAKVPGWRDVLIVAGVVVGIVLGAAVLTSLLPRSGQDLVFHTPLAIVILIAGTVLMLVRAGRRSPPAD